MCIPISSTITQCHLSRTFWVHDNRLSFSGLLETLRAVASEYPLITLRTAQNRKSDQAKRIKHEAHCSPQSGVAGHILCFCSIQWLIILLSISLSINISDVSKLSATWAWAKIMPFNLCPTSTTHTGCGIIHDSQSFKKCSRPTSRKNIMAMLGNVINK